MWRFNELESGMPERDPRETEFFRLPQVSDALVREVIQNSLDAKMNGESKIKVVFTFGNTQLTKIQDYLNGLIPHLQATDFFPLNFSSMDSLPFLTIEDFYTTGLDGPTGEDGLRPEKGKSNFFDFWWREGISGKTETRAGRWGLGKTTFHIVSKLRTFWGFTVRQNDSRGLLMGKALLKTHYIRTTGYQYCGYFTAQNYKAISDTELIQDFKTKFLIKRQNEEHGLSLVIPMPGDDVSSQSVLRSVIIHYFYPVARGFLEVEILNENADTILIQKDNLIHTAVQQDWSGTSWEGSDVREILEFVFDSISSPPPVNVNIPDSDKPEITEAILGTDLANFKGRFNNGDVITFRVPATIKLATNTQVSPTYLTVHLKKFPRLKTSEEFWFRSRIRITDIRTLGNRPVRAIVVADDPPIATFLGDAETPAHTDWKENTEGFKEKYQNAVALLRFIKKCVSKIVSLLDEPPRARQKDFLKEIFFILIPPEEGEDEETTRKPKIKGIKPKIPLFIINHIQTGFRVSLNLQNTNISLPLRATIKAAYDIRRGNPFTKYEPYDFDLTELQVNSTGCQILSKQGDEMRIEVTSREFNLNVTGFDTKRDLVVMVTEDQYETQI
jgi:hypothetical protein